MGCAAAAPDNKHTVPIFRPHRANICHPVIHIDVFSELERRFSQSVKHQSQLREPARDRIPVRITGHPEGWRVRIQVGEKRVTRCAAALTAANRGAIAGRGC
jgi:hypothetical protein